MKTFFYLAVAVLYSSLVLAQSEKAADQLYKGPLCLASFCLDKSPLPSERDLVFKHGPGLRIGEFRCYAVTEQSAFIHFGVEHNLPGEIVTVLVSDAPNCNSQIKPPVPKSPFAIFQTKEGIRLGDSREKVLRTYGAPSSIRDGNDAIFKLVPVNRGHKTAPFGETALVYDGPSDELIQGIFYIRSGKVAAIYISRSE
jgi:hypothetical protein